MELSYLIMTIFCMVVLLEEKFYIAIVPYLFLIVIYYYLVRKIKAYKCECENINLIIKHYYLVLIGVKKELEFELFSKRINSIINQPINESEKIRLLDSILNNKIFSLFAYIYLSEAMNTKKSRAIYELLYFFDYLSKNHNDIYVNYLSLSLKTNCYFLLIMTIGKFLLNNFYELVYTNIYINVLTILVVVGYIIIDLIRISKIKKKIGNAEDNINYLIMSFFTLVNIETPYNALIETINLCEINGVNDFEKIKGYIKNGNTNSLFEYKFNNKKINYFLMAFLKMTKTNSYNQAYQIERNIIINNIIEEKSEISRNYNLFKYILFGIYLFYLCYLIVLVY